MNFAGKKLLVLAGASVHSKVVMAAKEMGIHTIVTDNLPYEKSPAKQMADEYWDNDIYDIKGIVRRIKEEHVDAVISGWIDPCQRPYALICKELGLPCYGTLEQFVKMTDKRAFKKMCYENDVDTIPEYSISDAENGRIEYPVFVKPSDSRGSRGQTVVYSYEDLMLAIEFARLESSDGEVIIEKYMKGAHEFQVTYFFVDGEPYLLRTCDSYCGSEENHMEKVVACSISPSKYTQLYLETTHNKVMKMFKMLGIKNGPIFMQGFVDNGIFRFFDPGLRFPGVDYERIYKNVFGIDLMKAMISLALNGICSIKQLPEDGVWLKGKRSAILFPSIKAGTISIIQGLQDIKEIEGTVSVMTRHYPGDRIEWTYNVNQRIAEIDCLADDTNSLIDLIHAVQRFLKPVDINGTDMTYEVFDTGRIC